MADEQIVTSIVAKADLSSLVSEVHRASASLQQLQRELLSSNRAIASSTKLANNLFRDTLTGSGQFSSHFVNLNSDVDKFGKNLDAGRLKLKSYFSTFREHATTQKGMIRELAKEQVMLQNSVLQPLGRNAQGLMQYNVMIPRGLDAVKNGTQLARMEMQIMNRALSEGAGSLINWGKNTQWAGRQLTVGLTVPLTMFGAAAGKAFREADAELVRLTKVYGGLAATSAGDLKAIREEVVQTAKSLSQTMGASFKDTIALGADIAATGQMGNELLGSIAETTRLSILGEVDRQDAMKATLSIQTAFKQNTEELTESINFLNAVENQTSTTLSDLVEAIPKAGPVIQQLGGDVKDLALYLTAMREGGINASEGANALKSGLASLINPTKQTVGMMSDFGIDVMGMVAKNTGDTTGLLTDLQKALDSLDPLSKARAMEQMFGKFQFARMSALLNNLGKEGSQTLQVMELMKASTSDLAGIAERELGMITESASGKYKRAMESLKASLADIGEDFLPIATKLLNAASKILDFFSNLPGPIKKAVTFLAGFTALVGPLIMLTGVLANFFGYITKGIVSLRAFFMKANGWKMLTPEIIAAQKAAEMVENAFYSDAAAAQVLHNALQKLVLDYQNLQAASIKGAVPVNPGVSTIGGSTIVTSGRRIVDPTDPYVGDPNTRAMSHINPRDPNNPATIFGGVPGAMPVNRGISRTPQIYMHDRLPDIEGLTSIKGISTGIVPGEAAKHHALMATLGMQSQQEIAALKKTIAMGGTVSRELLDTFDDILPITQRFADSAATQSAAIVQQMRNAEITVDQAKARIIALNAQIEADMGAAVSLYAAGRGRTIDLTRAPMMDQPVVDANGQFTLRDLYKKKANLSVMNEFGRLRGIRTFGAPYSIQTTRPPRFNTGGSIESFGPSKTMVSGSSSINYDDRLGNVPVGGYVLNQQAAMDPANAALVAMAPSTYLNNGGNITAALTPREVVFGPQIQRMPELYAAVDAANSGYNFGGQIMNGVTGYGRQTSKTPQIEDKAYYKKRLKEYLRFINNPRYEDDIRLRMIMLDAAEMVGRAKMPMSKAIGIATSNFDLAKQRSGGSLERFIDLRVKQVQGLERKFPELKLADSSDTRTGGGSKSLNYELNNVRSAMLADRRFKNVWDLIEGVSPTDIKNSKGMPLLEGLHARGHIKRHGTVGYGTRGHMGVAAVIPSGINSIMARLQDIGISPDVLNLSGADARKNFEIALKSVGMHRMTTVDDIATALEENNLFKTKAEIASGNIVRATPKQRNDLQMFLEAVMSRKRWVMIPRGRPPMMTPVLARLNKGGMIPGGTISRDRSSYGNVAPLLRLLTPTQQLKVLEHARSMSFTTRSIYPETSYGHIIAPTTGRSFPVPGVGGVYDDEKKRRVFFKAVPNEPSLIAETRGTEIGRILGLITPVQTRKTIRNPLDPSRKSKFLGAESDYDEGFINPNTAVAGKFTQDEVIDQLIASMIFANKDLSRSNVHGRRLADVGNGGVLAKASMNSDFADKMPSMEEMAMINLLQVRGGARKDFAHDTAPIIAQMTPKQYGAAIKKKMEAAYPELKAYVNSIPRKERKPYLAMLKRFEEGMDVKWAKYHPMHANPKYHAGGPIGPIPIGGPIKKGRSAYGRKGNPAARAEQERLKAERAASYRGSTGSSYTASGNPQMQVARVPYVGGTGVAGNAYAGVPTASMARTVSTMRLAQFPYMNMPTMPMNIPGVGNTAAISAAFASMGTSIKRDSIQLAKAIDVNARVIAMSTKASAQSLIANTKSMSTRVMASSRALASSMQSFGNRAVTGAINFKGAVIQEQNAYAARHYPPGMAPTQGFFGPGMIGGYRDVGEGVQSRKVGSFGFRKTEYLVNNAATGGQAVTMNKAQAQAAGASIPVRANGMSMGAQMGIGMAGSMGGMALMGKEKVNIFGKEMSGMSAGMGLMIGSSILPMLPFAKAAAAVKTGVAGVTAAVRTLAAGAATAAKIVASIARFAKAFGPIGAAISTVVSGLMIYKKFQDAKQDASMGLSMTAKAAEQAGIKYFDLNAEMKAAIENRKLLSAAAKGGEGLEVGLPGIAMSVKDMKQAKEEGKKLKDFIESLNRSEGFDETLRLVNNQKAQFIAAGMSVEEANKKVYGALANSERNGDTFRILSDKTFAGISDKANAASFAVGNLINTLNKGAGTVNFAKEVGEGFEGLINIFDLTTKALIGTKDEAGNVIDEFAAYKQVMTDFQNIYGDKLSKPIGEEAYNDLARSNHLLGEITTKADSVEGILAKWTLFSAGFAANLQKVDSDLAIRLAGFTSALQGAVTDLGEAGGTATTFATVETALEKLQKTINKTSAASQRAANAAQRNAQEELKLISKKIKLIDDEKNKKLESLRATQEASNYALELQKLQIEYADAISRGDMATATRAQLDIDQLTLNRQSELAQKAVEDAAAKLKAPLEKKAIGIQDKSDARANAASLASDNSSAAKEVVSVIEGYQKRYNQLAVEQVNIQLLPPEEQRAAQKEVDRKLLALIKEIQKSGTGNSVSAKYVRDGFAKYFTESGKAIELQTTSMSYVGSTLTEVKTINKKILESFQLDAKAVEAQALAITGGVKLNKLRDDLVAQLARYMPNTPYGTAKNEVFNSGSVKDYSSQKNLGKAGGEAAKPPTLGGSGEKYVRTNNDGMSETFTVFTYKQKSYVVDMNGNIYKYDYTAQTVLDLDKPAVGVARAMGGQVKHFGPGGNVSGPGTPISDSIPAMLSDGEYVIRASAVDAYGVETFDALNAQKFHKGGPVNHAHLPDGTLAPSKISLGYNQDPIQVLPSGTVWNEKLLGLNLWDSAWNNKFYSPPTKNYGIDKVKSPMGSLQRFLDIARSQIGAGHNYRLHDKRTPRGEVGKNPEYDLGMSDVNKFNIWGNKKFDIGRDDTWWCGHFVAWVAEKAGVEISDKMHSAWQATQQYKKQGLFNDLTKKNNYKNIKVGDLAWWDYANDAQNPGVRDHVPDHASIVSRTGKDFLSVIGWFDGDEVKEKSYSNKSKNLFGSVSPSFKKPELDTMKPQTIDQNSVDTLTATVPGFAQGGLAQDPNKVLFSGADPQPAVDYSQPPSTPISKLGKTTQAQIKYLKDWTNLLNTYYSAKYKGQFDLGPNEKIVSGFYPANVIHGLQKQKSIIPWLQKTSEYRESQVNGAYWHDSRAITMGLANQQRGILYNPYHGEDGNLDGSVPNAINITPAKWLEDNAKETQKNPFSRAEMLTVLFHEFAHALQFSLSGKLKNTQSLMGLGENGSESVPTPGFSNVETSADLMAGGIFKEMYSNGYIPQIKASVIQTLLGSKILKQTGTQPNFNVNEQTAPEARTWHPLNDNFRFQTWAKGFEVGDSEAIDDSIVSNWKILTDDGSNPPAKFGPRANIEAAKAAITKAMIPKGFHKGGPVGHKHKYGTPSPSTSYSPSPMSADAKDYMAYIAKYKMDAANANKGSWWDQLGSKMMYGSDGVLKPTGMLGFGVLDSIKSLGAVALGSAVPAFPARERDIRTAAETTLIGPASRLFGSKRFPNPWGEEGMGMSSGWAKGMDIASIAASFIPGFMAARTSQQTAANAAVGGLAKPKATYPSLAPTGAKPMPAGYALKYDASGSMHRIDVKVGDETAGYLVWDKKTGVVENLHVYDKHQGKGIGTTMYEEAMEIAPITHSAYRTPAGDRFAHSIGDPVVPLNDSWLPGGWTQAQLDAARLRNQNHVVTRFPIQRDPSLDGFRGADIIDGRRIVGTENWGSLITENSDIKTILAELSSLYRVDVHPSVVREAMAGSTAGYYKNSSQSIHLPEKTRGKVVAHEITHAADFQGAYWSFEDMLRYLLKEDRKSAEIIFNEPMMNAYLTSKNPGPFNKKPWLYDSVEENITRYAPQHLPYWQGLLEKNATGKIPNVSPGGLDLGNPYTAIYGVRLSSMLKSSIEKGYSHYRDPSFWQAIIADENMPSHLVKKGEGYIEALNRYGVDWTTPADSFQLQKLLEYAIATRMANGGLVGIPKFEAGINVVPKDMLAMIHKNEAVVPANMNPFNPNATSSAIASGSVYNIQVELNGTTVTAQDVATAIHKEMKIKEMTAGVNRRVSG